MRITDPRAMRALAHPLRLDLIELLGTYGDSTAAQCARRLNSNQASCSFHLRQLAKYGYVEQAEPTGDARERPWRLTDIEQSWSPTGAAAEELERVFVQREAERILSWRSQQEAEPWRDTGFLGGSTVPMTAEELAEVRNQLHAVLAPYIDRLSDRTDWPEDHRFVRIFIAGTPHTENGD
ncbi:ArsR/SmtB family transcription factor [Natronoglycomyces albus]|uniref:Winged helix-turn-helix transcriptional regulator n=1 Tax=Natronoglycomyces albus TaxID=2811108 RepID=A0A895XI84_9ACTN|nr:winged helix-turn-helix domain-containing protein [Natronoglycomyces albus]QSB04667.1 winged helix-turn-helix transcriptional regulator [Natronoglycomyces albus]